MYTKAEQLIHAVKRYRALYDICHGDYCKINVKEKIWKIIAENLEIESGQEARDQWFRLRDSHRIALRRQDRRRQKNPNGQIKPWIYQKQMEFLLPFMSSIGSTDIVVDGEEEEEDNGGEEGCIDEPEVIVLEDDFFNSTVSDKGTQDTSFDHSYNTHLIPPMKKKKRLSKYEILKERVENGLAVTDLSEILHPRTQRVLSSVYHSELTDVVSGVQMHRELNKVLESDDTDVSSQLVENVLKVIDKTEVLSHPQHPRLVEIERPPDLPRPPKVQVVTPQTQQEVSHPKIQRVLRSATQQKKVNVPCHEVPGILKQGKKSIFDALPEFSKQNKGFREGKSQQGKRKGGFSEVPERLQQPKRVSFVPEDEESLETEVYSGNDSDNEEVMLEFSDDFSTHQKKEKPQKPSKYDTLPNGMDVSSWNSQSTSESVTEKSKDALKLFFDSMFNLTNAMPHHFQAKIRRKLFEAVMEAEEEIYSNPAESVKFCGNSSFS
ncbi:uncharacterized protein LOC111060621 [Nilaparvata lugens]|uniref:uncharacterized protein LOC111060621 n=1 Tax=Nilaparvata lugens TaxID=108931 RepID=UPI00193D16A9|nr:uncharacterized protein LOC111060621 [Nilaparvata lugens]